MEPMYIYAVIQVTNHEEEEHRRRLERYFVARDAARTARRVRIRRLRSRFIDRGTARPTTVELALR